MCELAGVWACLVGECGGRVVSTGQRGVECRHLTGSTRTYIFALNVDWVSTRIKVVLNYLHVSIFVMNVFIECGLSVYKVKVVKIFTKSSNFDKP